MYVPIPPPLWGLLCLVLLANVSLEMHHDHDAKTLLLSPQYLGSDGCASIPE